jgi:hypothetical protein
MTTDSIAARSRLHRKANEALDQNLVPGERVLVVITGSSSQAIIGTDQRAFVYKKGFMAGASFGSELTSWDYRNLVGVQLHTGMMSGAVILQAPGQNGTRTNVWKQGDSDPYKAPNAIPIARPYEQAQAGVARLRQLIDGAHRMAHTPSSPPPPPPFPAASSLVNEINRLAELHARGALTDHEFAGFKARLLNGG